MYGVCEAVFKSVIKVAIRPFGSPCDFLEISRILGYRLSPLTKLDQLFLGLGDIVTSLESSIESFDEGCPYGRKWEGGIGVLVVRLDRLEIRDGP